MPEGLALVLGRWLDRPGWGMIRQRVGGYLAKPRAIPEPPRLRLETPAGVLVATPERLPGETVYECARRTHPGREDTMLCSSDLTPLDPAEPVGGVEVLVVVRRGGKSVEGLAWGNKLGELRWAIATGRPWSPPTSWHAAENGHLKLLQWAIANGCPWHPGTSNRAAQHGHLELLVWAIAHGCPWHARTSWHAAREGHLELLVWALANGCQLHPDTRGIAYDNSYMAMVAWLDARA